MSRYNELIDGANLNDFAEAELGFNYYGYSRTNGSWVILRESTDQTQYRYAIGNKNYSTNFTNRANLTYKTADKFKSGTN